LTCRGNIYASRQEFAEAESQYCAAQKALPDNLSARDNLAGQLAHQNGVLAEAEELIRHALARTPDSRDPGEDTLKTIQLGAICWRAKSPPAGPE